MFKDENSIKIRSRGWDRPRGKYGIEGWGYYGKKVKDDKFIKGGIR